MFPHVNEFFPEGLVTEISLTVILLHTVGLEQTREPMTGSCFLLVFPVKPSTKTSEMVKEDGYCLHRFRFL